MTKIKEEFDIDRNGLPYKIIIIKNEYGEIRELMEKPKLNYIPHNQHVSGAHMFRDKPEQNHYDNWISGSKFIERPKKFGSIWWVNGRIELL